MPRLPPSGPLDHVLWIGGSACAGKSAVAALLAARHGLAVYSCDDAFDAHRRRAAGRAAFGAVAEAPPERLFAPPAARRAEELAAFYRAAFPLVVEDLAAGAGSARLLAEGVGLLPDLVASAAGRPRAVFLVAADAFRRRHARARPAAAGLLARCRDSAAAWEVWMERDRLLAARIAEAARRLGLPVVDVEDGGGPAGAGLAATAHRVAALLGLDPPRHAAPAALSSSG